MATVCKGQLYEDFEKATGWSKATSTYAVNQVLEVIQDRLAAGYDVQVTNFCTFKIKDRKGYKVKSVDGSGFKKIPKRKGITISPSDKLKKLVNSKSKKKFGFMR